MRELTFQQELEILINQHSKENETNTPDFILANYMNDCLNAYTKALKDREKWVHSTLADEKL